MNRANWGIRSAQTIKEVEKPDSTGSIIRVRVIETRDNKRFIDIRNWYNRNGDTDFPNMGKGLWIPVESSSDIAEGLLAAISVAMEGSE